MKKKIRFSVILILIICKGLMGQFVSGPYTLKYSEEFKSPKRYALMKCMGFGKDGIIQIENYGLKSFSFQHFSNDMKMIKQNIVNTETRIPENSSMISFSQINGKTYLFTRKEQEVSALEFFHEHLDFASQSVSLFKSTDRMKTDISVVFSNNESRLLFYYSLVPKIKRDKLSKEIIGFQVFDPNLKKEWEGEFEMPYSEAKMDILDYTLADDGKIYLSAKVYKSENGREKTKDGEVNYQYEVFVFQKDDPAPKTVAISLDGKFTTWASIFEDVNHHILIAGFYSKKAYGEIEGAYMVKLDVEQGTMSKINGGFYEIPTDVMKEHASIREKKKLDKKEGKGKDIGVYNLEIRKMYTMQDASLRIIAEEYQVTSHTYYNSRTGTSSTSYTSHANDLYVFNIDAKGNLEWIKKIAKAQSQSGSAGQFISLNSMAIENDIHIFYLDRQENDKVLQSNAPPLTYAGHRGGNLIGTTLDSKGNVTRHNLGDVKEFKTNFFIRYFTKGGNNNLISTERRKKKNILFSLEVK